jgi:hypothetical protein
MGHASGPLLLPRVQTRAPHPCSSLTQGFLKVAFHDDQRTVEQGYLVASGNGDVQEFHFSKNRPALRSLRVKGTFLNVF